MTKRQLRLCKPIALWTILFLSLPFSDLKATSLDFRGQDFNSRMSPENWIQFDDVDSSRGQYGTLRASFRDYAMFDSVNFQKNISFSWCDFDSTLVFNWTIFSKEVEFSYASFSGDTYFLSSDFHDELSFAFAEFNKKVIFDQCILPKYLDFNNVYLIANEIDLTSSVENAKFQNCQINLVGADISKFKFHYGYIRLYFHSAVPNEQRKGVYLTLLNRFHELGYTESYRELDLEFREFENRITPGIFSTISHFTRKLWWNFGYDKERIFAWTFGAFFVFYLVNFMCFVELNTSVYEIPSLWTQHFDAGSLGINKFGMLAFLYTCFIFFGIKFEPSNIKLLPGRGAKLKITYILLQFTVGLVCLAFLANYLITT